MGQQLNRRALSLVIAATVLLAAACSTGGSKSGSTTILSAGSEETSAASPASTDASTTATLHAETAGVLVNDVEVPNGETRPITIDERIDLGPRAQARLRVGELELLLTPATARLLGWDQQEIRLYLEKGIVDFAFDEGSLAHLLLTTSSQTTLRTVQPGTKITVCQGDGVAACVCVDNGEVEWEQQGKIERYVAPQCSFALAGQPPQPAKCLAPGVFDTWFHKVLRNEEFDDLGKLVQPAQDCAAAGPPPETPASSPDTQHAGSGSKRPPKQGGSQPGTPVDTGGTPAPPIDTPAPPIDTPAPPIDTPAPPIDTPAPPIDTPAPPIDTPAPPGT